jgi:hypothetical protein
MDDFRHATERVGLGIPILEFAQDDWNTAPFEMREDVLSIRIKTNDFAIDHFLERMQNDFAGLVMENANRVRRFGTAVDLSGRCTTSARPTTTKLMNAVVE